MYSNDTNTRSILTNRQKSQALNAFFKSNQELQRNNRDSPLKEKVLNQWYDMGFVVMDTNQELEEEINDFLTKKEFVFELANGQTIFNNDEKGLSGDEKRCHVGLELIDPHQALGRRVEEIMEIFFRFWNAHTIMCWYHLLAVLSRLPMWTTPLTISSIMNISEERQTSSPIPVLLFWSLKTKPGLLFGPPVINFLLLELMKR